MPTTRVRDITMYYEIQGAGEPLLLISGLASDHTLYRAMVPQLAQRYQVIVFDNRGVGATDKPDMPYSIELMADDTAGLLDALGITRAHVLGTSLGGRIAVMLALRHPEQVASLILISTVLRLTRPTWRRRLLKLQLRIPVMLGRLPYYAAVRQLEASTGFDCMDRLGEIHVPTLILHGRSDRLAPYPLAEAMHAGIASSRMLTFRGGHRFFILQTRPVVAAIETFLEPPTTTPPPP